MVRPWLDRPSRGSCSSARRATRRRNRLRSTRAVVFARTTAIAWCLSPACPWPTSRSAIEWPRHTRWSRSSIRDGQTRRKWPVRSAAQAAPCAAFSGGSSRAGWRRSRKARATRRDEAACARHARDWSTSSSPRGCPTGPLRAGSASPRRPCASCSGGWAGSGPSPSRPSCNSTPRVRTQTCPLFRPTSCCLYRSTPIRPTGVPTGSSHTSASSATRRRCSARVAASHAQACSWHYRLSSTAACSTARATFTAASAPPSTGCARASSPCS